MSHRFSGIPLHARREDQSFKSVSASERHPWMGREIEVTDDRIYLMPERQDITEAWRAFAATLPTQHSVTFTWTDPPEV